jgi:hypothetical protein
MHKTPEISSKQRFACFRMLGRNSDRTTPGGCRLAMAGVQEFPSFVVGNDQKAKLAVQFNGLGRMG